MPETEVIKGRLERSGVRFKILVSDLIEPDDLRAIANLLHGLATKLENDPRYLDSAPAAQEGT